MARTQEEIFALIRYDLKDHQGSYRSYLFAGDETTESTGFKEKRDLVWDMLEHKKSDFTPTEIGKMLMFPVDAERHNVPADAVAAFRKIVPLLEEAIRLPMPTKSSPVAGAPAVDEFALELATLAKELNFDMTMGRYVKDYAIVKAQLPVNYKALEKICRQDANITSQDLESLTALPNSARFCDLTDQMAPTFLADYGRNIVPKLARLRMLQTTPEETALADVLNKFWRKHGAKLNDTVDSSPASQYTIGFQAIKTNFFQENLSVLLEAGRALNSGKGWIDYKVNMPELRKALERGLGSRPLETPVYGPLRQGDGLLKAAKTASYLSEEGYTIISNAALDMANEKVAEKIDKARTAVHKLSQQTAMAV